jgi:hypothetical protein
MMKRCRYCDDFGYVQIYDAIVMRVFCDCPAGDRRIQEIKNALIEIGLDPDEPKYKRRKQKH